MTYYCKLCEKSVINKSKNIHSKSINHKTLDYSNIRTYIFLTPNFDDVDEIMRKYNNIYNENMIYMGFIVY